MAEQTIKIDLSDDAKRWLLDLVDTLEANKAKPESCTAACLAAGRGRDEEAAARLAGWQARWVQLRTFIEARLGILEIFRQKLDSTEEVDIRIKELRGILEGFDIIEEADATGRMP